MKQTNTRTESDNAPSLEAKAQCSADRVHCKQQPNQY